MSLRRVILGLLLGYQALFLNVFLPGHTRGAVTLDGTHTADRCCCCATPGGSPRPAAGRTPAAPSQRDKAHCAICDFAARVVASPVIDLRLSPLGLLARLSPPPAAVTTSVERVVTYLGTGPPAVHA